MNRQARIQRLLNQMVLMVRRQLVKLAPDLLLRLRDLSDPSR